MKTIKSRPVAALLIILAIAAIAAVVIITLLPRQGNYTGYPTTQPEVYPSPCPLYEYDPPATPISYNHLFPTVPGYAAAVHVGNFIFLTGNVTIAQETFDVTYSTINHPRW